MNAIQLRLNFHDEHERWSNDVNQLSASSLATEPRAVLPSGLQGFSGSALALHCDIGLAALRTVPVPVPVEANQNHGFLVPLHYLATLSSDGWAHEAAAPLAVPMDSVTSGLTPLDFIRLLHSHMRIRDNEALQQGYKAGFGTFTNLVNEAGRCATLGDALRQFVQSMRILRPDLIAAVRCGRGTLCLSINPRQMMAPAAELETEVFALTAHCAFRALVGGPLAPTSVRAPRDGRFQGGIDGPSLLSLLGCEVERSGSGVTLEYSHSDGDRPINPRGHSLWAGQELAHFREFLAHIAPQDAEEDAPLPTISIIEKVEDMLRQSMFHEPQIAASLGMSTASLRRRMSAAGTSFRAVIDQHRQQRVEALLYTAMPLADIAIEAGYSDVRSLRRACSKWFGNSPADLRRKHRSNR